MRVLQACAEIFPLLKTGGLADVAGALPSALRGEGLDVRVVLPGFPSVLAGLNRAVTVVELPAIMGVQGARILFGDLQGCDTQGYVIDAPSLYQREGGPYADAQQHPYLDNHRRFALLGWVAAELTRRLDPHWSADLVHAHDWHAALAPAYLHAHALRSDLPPVPSVYTVHNLAYQGNFSAHHFHELDLPVNYFGIAGLEFHGQLSFMKAGLFFADHLTTVSPTYAQEIQGPEQGCGLDGLLRGRSADLTGVLNGVDDKVWNPATDALISHRYDARRLSMKARNKLALQQEMSLQVQNEQAMICIISRLTEQKGLHLLLQALPALMERGLQCVLLGNGDAAMEAQFQSLAAQHPQQLAIRIGYDEPLAHRIIAGSDMILVPSRFEPCGLTQLYGLAYGTVPVVRRVGGLADTVQDTRLETLDQSATGFVFDEFHAAALVETLDRALALWRRPRDWQAVQRRGMAEHFDWRLAAKRYAAIYQSLM